MISQRLFLVLVFASTSITLAAPLTGLRNLVTEVNTTAARAEERNAN